MQRIKKRSYPIKMKTEKAVRTADVVNRKKPKMQRITIGIEVENEKGGMVIGCVEEEWLATLTAKEILEKVKEAINEIE